MVVIQSKTSTKKNKSSYHTLGYFGVVFTRKLSIDMTNMSLLNTNYYGKLRHHPQRSKVNRKRVTLPEPNS